MASHDPLSRRPEPTRLVLLNQVNREELGTKIRFLGCVYEYQGNTATLVLRAEFTKKDTVKVNIQNVLETIDHELLEVGAWLNVVGYIRRLPKQRDKPNVPAEKVKQRNLRTKAPIVDATMLWSAGAINLERYQSAVHNYQSTNLKDF